MLGRSARLVVTPPQLCGIEWQVSCGAACDWCQPGATHVLWRRARRSRPVIYPVSRRGPEADVVGLKVRPVKRCVEGVMRVESEAVARGKQVFVPSHHIADGCAAREASVNRPSVGYPYIPQVSRTGRKQATTQPHTPGPSSPFWSREDTLRPKIEGSVYAWHL